MGDRDWLGQAEDAANETAPSPVPESCRFEVIVDGPGWLGIPCADLKQPQSIISLLLAASPSLCPRSLSLFTSFRGCQFHTFLSSPVDKSSLSPSNSHSLRGIDFCLCSLFVLPDLHETTFITVELLLETHHRYQKDKHQSISNQNATHEQALRRPPRGFGNRFQRRKPCAPPALRPPPV